MRSTLLVTLSSFLLIVDLPEVDSFNNIQRTVFHGPQLSFTSSRIPTPSKFGRVPMVSASYAPSSGSDPVLREFEVKEAAIERQREKAAAKLAEFETTLQLLQSKKQEYVAASQLPDSPVGGSFSETTLRSAVKAFCWRILAGSITFATTLKFSGSLSQALQVVGADFFSKSFTMFLGERLMNKSQAGRKKGGDAASRSLVKALVWRLFAICNTLTMAIFISKDLSVASKIASTDAVFKTALMFFYERVWARINWGKEYLIEFSI
jgi:uncharacterized membrane protein